MMISLLLASEVPAWITTGQGILNLIIGAVGLLSGAVGVYFAIKNFIKNLKNKSIAEIWGMIKKAADAAMKEAEASGKKGADKKEMVIEAVKAACKSAGVNIDVFMDQLNDYIDQTISFVNDMHKK